MQEYENLPEKIRELIAICGCATEDPFHRAIIAAFVYGQQFALEQRWSLDNAQCERLDKWKKEQERKIIEQQKQSNDPHIRRMAQSGVPFEGASGGAYVYSMCPTSLGTVYKVRNTLTDNSIDLTDYDGW